MGESSPIGEYMGKSLPTKIFRHEFAYCDIYVREFCEIQYIGKNLANNISEQEFAEQVHMDETLLAIRYTCEHSPNSVFGETLSII